MTTIEIYENSGGGVDGLIYEDEKPCKAFGNLEYNRGSALGYINSVVSGDGMWKSFGGDYGCDIEMPHKFVRNERDNYDDVGEMTIDELFESIREGSDLIAWTDEDGVHYSLSGSGYGATTAFGVEWG